MDPYTIIYKTFTPQTIPITPTISIYALTSSPSSTKPPLLLLHGFPQNLLIWHHITPHLIPLYTLILLDLRGYGKSSKPPGGEENPKEYSKSTMATDCVTVMTKLGHEKFYICAHDRGARVAHKLCTQYPERVMKAILLDIAPPLAMYPQTDMAFAKAYWHWFFLIQKAPFPETLMVKSAREWITMCGLNGFKEECVKSYIAQVGDEETAHGMCEDYRAGAGIDLEEAREDVEKARKVECPLRVLWGRGGVIEKQFDALGEWKKVSREGVVSGENVDSGHFIPEEAPEVVVKHIKEFLRD